MKRLSAGFRLQRPDWTVDPLLARHRRPWGGLVASVLAHSLILLLVLGLLGTRETASNPDQPTPSSPFPQVAMIYLPPPPRAAARPQPAPAPTPPPPAARQQAPDAVHAPTPAPSRGPEPRPDDVSGHESPGTTPPEPEKPEGDPAPPAPKTAPAQPTPATLSSAPLAPDTATMISEAQRLFGGGRRLQNTAAGLGAPTLPGDRYSAERTSCLPPPRPPGEKPELAQVSGIIYQPNHRPLGGALLQIVGTQYSTFSDEQGYYRLTFDASLVTQCRTQYVRVTADGFRARDLTLGLGPGINDVTLQRF